MDISVSERQTEIKSNNSPSTLLPSIGQMITISHKATDIENLIDMSEPQEKAECLHEVIQGRNPIISLTECDNVIKEFLRCSDGAKEVSQSLETAEKSKQISSTPTNIPISSSKPNKDAFETELINSSLFCKDHAFVVPKTRVSQTKQQFEKISTSNDPALNDTLSPEIPVGPINTPTYLATFNQPKRRHSYDFVQTDGSAIVSIDNCSQQVPALNSVPGNSSINYELCGSVASVESSHSVIIRPQDSKNDLKHPSHNSKRSRMRDVFKGKKSNKVLASPPEENDPEILGKLISDLTSALEHKPGHVCVPSTCLNQHACKKEQVIGIIGCTCDIKCCCEIKGGDTCTNHSTTILIDKKALEKPKPTKQAILSEYGFIRKNTDKENQASSEQSNFIAPEKPSLTTEFTLDHTLSGLQGPIKNSSNNCSLCLSKQCLPRDHHCNGCDYSPYHSGATSVEVYESCKHHPNQFLETAESKVVEHKRYGFRKHMKQMGHIVLEKIQKKKATGDRRQKVTGTDGRKIICLQRGVDCTLGPKSFDGNFSCGNPSHNLGQKVSRVPVIYHAAHTIA